MTTVEDQAQTYSWNWFALHAGQRLQMVNFWLVSVAFLVAAFVQARASNMVAIAVGVSVTGVVSSLAFMQLDIRTRELVQVGENALRVLEKKRTEEGLEETAELVRVAHQSRSRLSSYRVVIQGLQLSVTLLFALAALQSLLVS